jgi:hypothetical protein
MAPGFPESDVYLPGHFCAIRQGGGGTERGQGGGDEGDFQEKFHRIV